MTYVKYTRLLILATVLIWIGFDVWVIVKGGTEASISHQITTWSYDYPTFTFAVGYLMGHLFFPLRTINKILAGREDRLPAKDV
jgi:hypothetical protein